MIFPTLLLEIYCNLYDYYKLTEFPSKFQEMPDTAELGKDVDTDGLDARSSPGIVLESSN